MKKEAGIQYAASFSDCIFFIHLFKKIPNEFRG